MSARSFWDGSGDAVQHGKKYFTIHDQAGLFERVFHRLDLLEPCGFIKQSDFRLFNKTFSLSHGRE